MGRNIVEIIIKADNQASAQLKAVAADAKGMGGAFSQAATIIASAGAIVATALTAMIVKTAEWEHELQHVSERLGVSTEFLSGMEYALKTTGGEIGNFQIGMKLLASTLQDAINGNAEAQKKFDALGISIRDASGNVRGAQEMFFVFADRIAQAKTSTEAMAIATDFFGRNALTLLPLLKQGSAGIKELMDRNKELGGELSTNAAVIADKYNVAMVDLKTSLKGIAITITGEFLPALTALNTFLANGIPEWWKFIRSINPFQKSIDNIAWVIDKVTRKGAPPTPVYGPVLANNPFAGIVMDKVAAEYAAGQTFATEATAKTTEAVIAQTKAIHYQVAALKDELLPVLASVYADKGMNLGSPEALPAMVNPLADSWQAGLDEFDIKGMDVARDLTQEFGGMFSQIAQKGVNAAEVFDSAWRSAIGSVAAKLAEMAIWKVGGSILGTVLGFLPFLNEGGEVKGAASGLEAFGGTRGRDTIPTMIGSGEVVMPSPTVNRLKAFLDRAESSLQGAVNVYPLFFSGSRQDSQLAAEYIQRRLDGNSRFVIEGSL